MNDTSEQTKPNQIKLILLVPILVAHSPWSGGESETRNQSKEMCRHTHHSYLISHFKGRVITHRSLVGSQRWSNTNSNTYIVLYNQPQILKCSHYTQEPSVRMLSRVP